jgi:hypothetical protein
MTTNIGFAIHDAARDGRAFHIEDGDSGRALVFGTGGSVPMQARGVLPAHFVLLPHEGALLVASSSVESPAYVGDVAIGTDWTLLEVPCRVRAGAAVIEIFVVSSQVADPEATRVGPLVLPVPGEPPKAAETTVKTRIEGPTPRSLAVQAAFRIRDDYQRLSRVKRLMVPIAGVLALLAFAQPSQAGESTAPPALPTHELAPVVQAPLQVQLSPQAPTPPRQGMLPSARSLPAAGRTQLSAQERVVYHKAIEAMLAGDFQTAYRLYDQLAVAHPDASDIRAAHRVLAGKIRVTR